MKIINNFQNADESVFAGRGELFGEIYLSDYLVMDEVAGHLINRSVMSVILRPKVEHSQSNRVYECSIKSKTPQLVIVKLNEVLCKDYIFEIGQEVYIDVKFRYNRLPMCEMHQAVDMCKQKTDVLLPNVKNVSYKDKVSDSVSFHKNTLFEKPVLLTVTIANCDKGEVASVIDIYMYDIVKQLFQLSRPDHATSVTFVICLSCTVCHV